MESNTSHSVDLLAKCGLMHEISFKNLSQTHLREGNRDWIHTTFPDKKEKFIGHF